MSSKVVSGNSTNLLRPITIGVIGGLVGGVVFGVMMASMDMLPMVGMLIGQQNALVGFVVHMVISAFIGATFGVITTRLSRTLSSLAIAGGVYGIVWWVLGALILMPLMLGMNQMVLQIGQPQIMSLIGHVLFGVVMGVIFKLAGERI